MHTEYTPSNDVERLKKFKKHWDDNENKVDSFVLAGFTGKTTVNMAFIKFLVGKMRLDNLVKFTFRTTAITKQKSRLVMKSLLACNNLKSFIYTGHYIHSKPDTVPIAVLNIKELLKNDNIEVVSIGIDQVNTSDAYIRYCYERNDYMQCLLVDWKKDKQNVRLPNSNLLPNFRYAKIEKMNNRSDLPSFLRREDILLSHD